VGTFSPPGVLRDRVRARGGFPCIVALEGASAAGKSAVLDAASTWSGWSRVREAVDRIDPPPSLEFTSPARLLALETQLLTEEARRYREAVALRQQGQFVLTDTGFWAPLVYTWGLVVAGLAPSAVLRPLVARADRWLAQGRWGVPDLAIYLDTPEEIRMRRARADPAHHPPQLQRRHQQIGRIERALFQKVFPVLLPNRIRSVSGAGPLAALAERVRAAVDAGPVVPIRTPEAHRVLSFLRATPVLPRAATVKKLAPSRRPPDSR
jgi:thymidylate kinase